MDYLPWCRYPTRWTHDMPYDVIIDQNEEWHLNQPILFEITREIEITSWVRPARMIFNTYRDNGDDRDDEEANAAAGTFDRGALEAELD